METNDILDNEPQPGKDQADNIAAKTDTLTNDEAVNVNGGEGEDAGSELDAAYREVAELKDKYLRLYADFENFRRRTAKEKIDLIGTANEGLLVSLLPVVDDFERAMPSFETATDVNALKEGVSLIYHKLTKTLEGKGLKPMTTKGEVFNADLHESVTQFPAPSDDLKGKVIDEIERGYTLNDKLIRFAKVIIGS